MGPLSVPCTIVDLLDDMEVRRIAVAYGVERWFVDCVALVYFFLCLGCAASAYLLSPLVWWEWRLLWVWR